MLLRSKLIIGCLLVVPLALATAVSAENKKQTDPNMLSFNFDWQMIGNKKKKLSVEEKERLQLGVEGDLHRSVKALEVAMRSDDVISVVKETNAKRSSMTLGEIMEIDGKWIKAKENDPLIASLTDESCGAKLQKFQKKNPEFVEVFVTDQKGLNVCETNKTSDFYQADEVWWKKANAANGRATHGGLEYDQSAETFAISVFVPIQDNATGKTIGVAKGVIKKDFGS